MKPLTGVPRKRGGWVIRGGISSKYKTKIITYLTN